MELSKVSYYGKTGKIRCLLLIAKNQTTANYVSERPHVLRHKQ